MRASRILFAALLALVFVVPSPLRAEDLVDAKTLRALEKSARDLASIGRSEETEIVLDVLQRLGHGGKSLERLRTACRKTLERSRLSASRLKTVRKKLAQTTTALAARLGDLGAGARVTLARELLRLDGDQAAAREALGHVEKNGRWMTPAKSAALEGSQRVQTALAKAVRRAFPIVEGDRPDPLVEKACGAPGKVVHWENVSVHGPFSRARLERILRRTLQARSLSEELLTGKPDRKRHSLDKVYILLDTKESYLRAIEIGSRDGTLDARGIAEARRMTSFWYGKKMVIDVTTEADILSILVYHLSDWRYSTPKRKLFIQPWLSAGHLNWLCLVTLGVPMPGVRWLEVLEAEEKAAGTRSTTVAPGERKRREQRMRVSQAGIVGCRSWMAYLAERREDPPLASAFMKHEGEIRGNPLLKATMVVTYLQEIGRFAEIADALAGPPVLDPAVFEKAIGTSLAEFEEAWRAWIVEESPGVLARLDGAGGERPSEGERLARDELARIRKLAFSERQAEDMAEVFVWPELSAGARAHALYLGKNPEQMAAWPDAHEEWPDREGYSVAGSAAGLRSVIAPDSRTPEQAITRWMGTFYHRLPLLAQGLRGIGWGHENGVAVLDAMSLRERWTSQTWFVLWPPDGMKDVPTRFVPELPNPVPGENQSGWGYPITIQGGLVDKRLTMKLFEGTRASGTEVPCHVSTPWEPTNIELAPDEAACLIPKAHLKPGATYTVLVTHLPEGKILQWSFRTGR